MLTPTVQHRVRSERVAPRGGCDRCHLVLDQRIFIGALQRERKRADRSNRALVVLHASVEPTTAPPSVQQALVDAVTAVRRDTDLVGWFEKPSQIGLIASDGGSAATSLAGDMAMRVRQQVERELGPRASRMVTVDAFVHEPGAAPGENVEPFARLVSGRTNASLYDFWKRTLDIVGASLLLAFLSPLFALIAALVKLKSPGPVLFRQVRVGQGMKPFTMLKFRTMHVNTGQDAHVAFVTAFITAGKQPKDGGHAGLFKIANDPRVTSIGRVLRKTSLDELPQLWNVFRGDMSLVGPRPPLFYEVEKYESWHRRRVLEAKPGVTGLWQVAGRSRTTFDEMVRLDLRYARTRSLWTDLKILLATPAAVIVGKGAV